MFLGLVPTFRVLISWKFTYLNVVHKAKFLGLIHFRNFNVDEYDKEIPAKLGCPTNVVGIYCSHESRRDVILYWLFYR